MDVATQHPVAHCCRSYGELRKLARFARKEESPLHTCQWRRNLRGFAQSGSKFSWAVPVRPCSLFVRSSSQDRQSIELPLHPALSGTPNECTPAAVFSLNESNGGASEGALASSIASENENKGEQGNTHASEEPNEDSPASIHSVEMPSLQNALETSLPSSTHSLQGRSTKDDNLPLASHRSDGQHNRYSGAGDEVRDTVDMVPSSWIKNIPPRYKLILSTSLAFVICNMDKVNLSVAIIPMSNQLHWNASTAGLVQSSFFWGYTLSQLPGGWLARWFTGEAVLGVGVFIWSVATAVVPITVTFIPALLFSRLIVGLGEGVSPSAATDLIARNIPATERSRAVAFVFNGLNVGSIIGLVLAPVIIEHFGWESVFYIFAALGIVWSIDFTLSTEWNAPWKTWDRGKQVTLKHLNKTDASFVGKATEQRDGSTTSFMDHEKVPWRAFFKSPSIWAMIYTHFCGNWGHYCILAWLPTYFSEELQLDLTNAALVAVLPPLGGMLVSGFAAPLADHLISRGVNVTLVRKLCQTIAFISPTVGMTITSLAGGLSPWVSVSIISSSLALSSFALGGLYCTHQDISPKYASILLGITNTAGAIPGVLGVYLTGVLLDHTHSWTMALFVPCIFFWITGALVWNIFASSEPQNFEG